MPETIQSFAASVRKSHAMHRDILASTRIRAESGRVLQALSMPEYMEAWMRPPGVERIEVHTDRRWFGRFTIALFAGGARLGCIFGSRLQANPQRITYSWERDAVSGCSLVEMNLWSYSGDCSLKLRHGGIQTRGERKWHLLMWNASLVRLRGLLEGSGVTDWGRDDR